MGLQEDERIRNCIKDYVKKKEENILRFRRNCPYRNSKKNRFDSGHNLYLISQFLNRRTNTGSRRITDECTKRISFWRIDGKEIARVEWIREGRVPLQTIRAKIDHCSHTIRTIYGVLGIKIWIFTLLNVADNSGAQELMCIRIIGTGNHLYAHIGDVIVAVIKEAVPNMPLERSEIIRAVIVRTCKELKSNVTTDNTI
ncbi:hypothetical protein IEQ34_025876 [Dendrobium chrysotoxum]|uniref:Small ribosomal subunit protein uS3 C-terminal domain-containing protein n=1 Tax=Dendrobium chrysotoxum TaxID=161865 RepID=A0AAV7FNF4_DENCH|nr:hypothetical protein IEQ34_025876 [Dendrobium chrysotoxum]